MFAGRVGALSALVAFACAQTSLAQLTLFDNFDAYSVGNGSGGQQLDDVTGGLWQQTPSFTGNADIEQEAPGDLYFAYGNVNDRGGYRDDGISILNDSTGNLLYWQMQIAPGETAESSFGLTSTASPGSFNDYQVEVRLFGNSFDGYELQGRNGGAYDVLQSGLSDGVWYDITVDVDTAADTFDVYFDSDENPNTLGTLVGSGLGFRNGATLSGLEALFGFAEGDNENARVDEIYFQQGVGGGGPTNVWNINGGGSYNAPGSWSENTVPTTSAFFGDILTADNAPATVTLDAPVSVETIQFQNSNAEYVIGGSQTLTLTEGAEVSVAAGRHWLSTAVAAATAITKTGSGDLVLNGSNAFTGGLEIVEGSVTAANAGAIPSGQGVAIGSGTAVFRLAGQGGPYAASEGFAGGEIDGVISGPGMVTVANGAAATFSGENTFTGVLTVEDDAVLTLASTAAVGLSNGQSASQTRVSDTGQLVLQDVTIGNEFLKLDERAREGAQSHLRSTGDSEWQGNIFADFPGDGQHYKIESTSGTLTLSGTISAFDEAAGVNDRTYVFNTSGSSTINVTGAITDNATNFAGEVTMSKAGNNVNVVKEGSGTLIIATGGQNVIEDQNFFHGGSTIIEAGTLEVVDSDAADAGELFSSRIEVRAGAVFDTSAFDNYSLQVTENPDEVPFNGDELGQTLAGAGQVNTGGGTFRTFEDSVLQPGDSGPGTLSFNGNLIASVLGPNPNGGLHYELSGDTTIGQGANDLIDVSGTTEIAAGSGGQFNLRVTPVGGNLATTPYTIIQSSSPITGTASGSDFAVTIVDSEGTPLNTRQTGAASVSGNSVTVSFTPAATRTWDGSGGDNTWDVATSSNWAEGDQQFRELDEVVFGAAAPSKTVVVNNAVMPGSTTFNSTSTYTLTGAGGITGGGDVNINAGLVRFQNSGNNYTGQTTVAAAATLEIGGAEVGGMVVDGTLNIGGVGQAVPAVEFTYIDADNTTNTELSGGGSLSPQADIWEIRTGLGGNRDTIFEANQDTPEGAPEIQTTITGLAPNTSYTVFANFWDAGGAAWRIAAGDTAGALTLFANPARNVGGATAALPADDFVFSTPVATAAGNRELYAAPLGTLVSDSSGNLVIYLDDAGADDGDDRTFYDGISFNTGNTSTFMDAETLDVNGDFLLNSGGTLQLDLGAEVADSIVVSGSAELDGTIDVDLVGRAPSSNVQFTILTAADGIGTALEQLDFGDGLPDGFTASYNADATELLLTFALGLPGDFNDDGMVDAADYTVWRDNLSGDESALNGNGDGSGTVDIADFNLWRNSFGNSSSSLANGTTAPEPASLLVAAIAAMVAAGRRQKNC